MRSARADFGFYSSPGPSSGRSTDTEVSLVSGGGDDSFADPVTVSTNLRSSIRILVIDDDRTLREGCASLLQVEGYTVAVSGRGDEAIEMLRRAPFDIVLVDLCMTPVSGVEILK